MNDEPSTQPANRREALAAASAVAAAGLLLNEVTAAQNPAAQGPGLGVEIDEKALARVAADPKQRFIWPVQRLRDGSIADY